MATALNLSDITGTNPAVQAAEIARLRAIFDGIDTDKSGAIDESELLGAMERLGYYYGDRTRGSLAMLPCLLMFDIRI